MDEDFVKCLCGCLCGVNCRFFENCDQCETQICYACYNRCEYCGNRNCCKCAKQFSFNGRWFIRLCKNCLKRMMDDF